MTTEDLKVLLAWARSKDDVRLVHATRKALQGDLEAISHCEGDVQMLSLMGVVWR